MSLRESFHEYFVEVNGILFNTYDRIFGDMKEHLPHVMDEKYS